VKQWFRIETELVMQVTDWPQSGAESKETQFTFVDVFVRGRHVARLVTKSWMSVTAGGGEQKCLVMQNES
jgi:hypothetical protein